MGGGREKNKKKAKKKSKANAKDSWTLDGGTEVEGKHEFVDENGRRIKRQTQEQDEVKRRGSLKTAYNDQAYALSRKLSKKIQFEKFAPAEAGEGEYSFDYMEEDDEDEEDGQLEGGASSKPTRRQSSLSVLHRLQQFSGNKHKGALRDGTKDLVSGFLRSVGVEEDDDDEGEASKDSEDEDEEQDTGKGKDQTDEDNNGMTISGQEAASSSSEVSFRRATAYDYLFAASPDNGKKNDSGKDGLKCTSLGQICPDYSLHGILQLPEVHRGTSPGDFNGTSLDSLYGPGLPKLWRDRSSSIPMVPSSDGTKNEQTESKKKKKKKRKGDTEAEVDVDSAQFSARLVHQLTYYTDVLLEGRDMHTDAAMLRSVLIHVCVHVVRARIRVLKHNAKVQGKQKEERLQRAKQRERDMRRKAGLPEEQQSDEEDQDDDSEGSVGSRGSEGKEEGSGGAEREREEAREGSMQDQGFVRPRVLILCPFRGVALRIFETIREILGENTTVASLDKLVQDYGPPDFSDDDDDDDDEEDEDDEDDGEDKDEDEEEVAKKRKRVKPSRGGRGRKSKPPPKPDDWQHDFRQNCDDDFKLGIQFNPGRGKGSGSNKGVYLRLFSDFFISDVIIASPLGLRLIIEKFQSSDDGDGGEDGVTSLSALDKQKKKNQNAAMKSADFLSSLELVVLHQADVLFMQNWDHVEFVLHLANQLPKSSHDTDFARVRPYFLDGKAKEHRQMILTSHFVAPALLSSFRRHSHSLCGNVRVKRIWESAGVVPSVIYGTRQVFQKVSCSSVESEEEERFNFFKENVLGPILRTGQGKTLIVTPNYLHYVRIRNELLKLEANSAFVCEYSRESEISRGRSRFYHGLHEILLYSGRCHYFRRFPIRGAQHVIFYTIPEYPRFYPELINLLSNEHNGQGDKEQRVSNGTSGTACSSMTLFSKYDKMALERIVGAKKAKHMLSSDKALFMFR